jgi:hypothetical protein
MGWGRQCTRSGATLCPFASLQVAELVVQSWVTGLNVAGMSEDLHDTLSLSQ